MFKFITLAVVLRFIIIASIAWLVGVFGWSQIIGSIQNIARKASLIFTIILWVAIMGVGAYFAIVKFDSIWPLVIGYVTSFFRVLAQGKIE